jgi:hypothetical protein
MHPILKTLRVKSKEKAGGRRQAGNWGRSNIFPMIKNLSKPTTVDRLLPPIS